MLSTKFRIIVVSLFVLNLCQDARELCAQEKFVANYDETKVPKYQLPDPLIMKSGQRVQEKETWENVRRPEILAMFEREMFGKTPESAKNMQGGCRYSSQHKINALGGKATRIETRIHFTDKADGPYLDLLIYIPNNAKKPVPAFMGLNFQGNQAITDEPDVTIAESWCRARGDDDRVVDNKSTENSRGVAKSRWPIETIIDRGYALVTAYYGDIDPDFDDGFKNGVQPLFYRDGQTKPDADEWGSIGAWAWGLSRGLDYLEEVVKDIDADRVAVIGHSRLGKTSLWAGAQDERFAMVISNDSGCGGAAISKRAFGETVGRINTAFPHWFCDNFNKYNNNEEALPFDQHELIALIAPRPVYVASAEKDNWADQRGELLGAANADAVYRLLGTDGIGDVISENATIADDGMIYEIKMPAYNSPIGATIHYHIRTGVHDVTDYDWEQYLNFADQYLSSRVADHF